MPWIGEGDSMGVTILRETMETSCIESPISTSHVFVNLPTPLGTRFSEVIFRDLHRTTARMTVGRKDQLAHDEFPENG